jgi:glycosyltransferase involved in cell wall biosynthesis
MAAGRPLLFVGDHRSDIARIIIENRCGAVVPSGDSKGLVEVITEWYSQRSQVEELGSAARTLFEERFDRAHAISAYLETFAKCTTLAPSPFETAKSHEATIEDTGS